MAPYVVWNGPYSTDRIATPGAWTTPADPWNWHVNSGFLANTGSVENEEWGYQGVITGEFTSSFPSWAPGTAYTCNSWIIEVRAGVPQVFAAGDTVSVQISGSFSGSPINLSYMVSAGDVTTLTDIGSAKISGTYYGSPANPIAASLITQINANASLSAAGITASLTNTVPGAGNQGAGAFQTQPSPGRIYLSYSGAVVTVNVTGSVTTSTGCDVYCQPNGDGCNVSAGGVNGRPLNYQAAANFTSAMGGAPSNTALQTVISTSDGGKWCFCPEKKAPSWATAGSGSATFPELGFGGAYGDAGWSNYLGEIWSSTAYMQTAGIPGAATARSNATAALNQQYKNFPETTNLFGFCVAP
jgi:hypothetical protein